jgi:hypothetical protein
MVLFFQHDLFCRCFIVNKMQSDPVYTRGHTGEINTPRVDGLLYFPALQGMDFDRTCSTVVYRKNAGCGS